MFQIDVIKSNAVGLCGWRAPINTDLPTIDAENLASRSGLIYQESSGLITIDNIWSTVEEPNMSDADFNARLKAIVGNAYIELLQKLFTSDDYIENDILYRYPNSWDETITLPAGFVGYEIDVKNCRNFSLILNRVILEMNNTETVNVYLFNDQQKEPIATIEVSAEERVASSKTAGNILSNYISTSNVYYLGYLTSGLTGTAYNRNYELANYQSGFMGAYVRSIRVDGVTAAEMFNPKEVVYTDETWGMNFELSSYYDYTSQVNSNENRYAKALQLQVAVNIVNMMANTVRSNKNERLSKASSMFELDGNNTNTEYPFHVGLNAKLANEVRRLRKTYFGGTWTKGTM